MNGSLETAACEPNGGSSLNVPAQDQDGEEEDEFTRPRLTISQTITIPITFTSIWKVTAWRR